MRLFEDTYLPWSRRFFFPLSLHRGCSLSQPEMLCNHRSYWGKRWKGGMKAGGCAGTALLLQQHLLVLLSDVCYNHRVLHSGQKLVNREGRVGFGFPVLGGVSVCLVQTVGFAPLLAWCWVQLKQLRYQSSSFAHLHWSSSWDSTSVSVDMMSPRSVLVSLVLLLCFPLRCEHAVGMHYVAAAARLQCWAWLAAGGLLSSTASLCYTINHWDRGW